MSELAGTIARQGEVLREVLDLDLRQALRSLDGARRVWLVGTGTSEHAARLGASMLATAGLDARSLSAAGFCARFDELGADDAVIVITHTTETAFARRGRELALGRGDASDRRHRQGQGLVGGARGRPARTIGDLHRQLPGGFVRTGPWRSRWDPTSSTRLTSPRSRPWSMRRSRARCPGSIHHGDSPSSLGRALRR
jgi:hypothetical protein